MFVSFSLAFEKSCALFQDRSCLPREKSSIECFVFCPTDMKSFVECLFGFSWRKKPEDWWNERWRAISTMFRNRHKDQIEPRKIGSAIFSTDTTDEKSYFIIFINFFSKNYFVSCITIYWKIFCIFYVLKIYDNSPNYSHAIIFRFANNYFFYLFFI